MEKQRGAALVTGAGRGIGRACAVALSTAGFAVVANDLTENAELEATVSEIKQAGGRAAALAGDIADVGRHEELVAAAWEMFGGLSCLVNNAGISVEQRDDILEITPKSFDRLIGVNLRGTFFLTQEVARRMLAQPDPGFRSIVTISSVNGEAASIDRGEYCISKTGLGMVTKLFAVRLAAHGVNVYEIRPGVIRTSMTAVARERYDALFAEGFAPINRWGEPEEVGRAVSTVASGSFPFSTGEVIRVDGGLMIRHY